MRRFIIDTDTASDDAAAIIMAALDPDVEILGVTAVAGNISVEQAAKNAKMTLEICGSDAPVYVGQPQPLFKERADTISVHGADGMGDAGIIHPQGTIAEGDAVHFILDTVKKYPDEIELVALGPATNIALAMMLDPGTMRHIKHIWSMGTPGLGVGNATPVAEFNVFIDPDAYAVMLKAVCPITIVGFDMCTATIGIDIRKVEELEKNGNAAGKFLARATAKLREFNENASGQHLADLPDALAMAAAIWPDYVKASVQCYCTCMTTPGETYGQVIFYQKGRVYESMPKIGEYRAELVTAIDEELFVRRLMGLLTKKLNV
jgi:purine nucleosidase